jgi:hypothetical protein
MKMRLINTPPRPPLTQEWIDSYSASHDPQEENHGMEMLTTMICFVLGLVAIGVLVYVFQPAWPF